LHKLSIRTTVTVNKFVHVQQEGRNKSKEQLCINKCEMIKKDKRNELRTSNNQTVGMFRISY